MALRPGRSQASAGVNDRLVFVIFALLLLVIVPVLVNFLIAVQERQIAAPGAIRAQLIRSAPAPHSAPGGGSLLAQINRDLAAIDRRQGRTQETISALRVWQFLITVVLGLLGILACWYTRHALQAMRSNLAALDAERQKLAAVIRTAGVGITLWDRQGWLVDLNPAAMRILGVSSPEEAQERLTAMDTQGHSANLLHPDGSPVPESERPARRALQGETFNGQEIRLRRGDGTCIWVLFAGCPGQHAADGTVTLGVNVFQDITARRENERQLEELVQANARRRELFERLAGLTATINSSLDLRRTLEAFLQEARGLLPFQRGCLALYPVSPEEEEGWVTAEQATGATDGTEDQETDLIRRLRGKGPRRPTVRTDTVLLWQERADGTVSGPALLPRAEAGLLGWSLEYGRPLLLAEPCVGTDSEEQPEAPTPRSAGETTPPPVNLPAPARSVLVAPLVAGNAVLGALQLESDRPDAFERSQVTLMQQLAGQLAAAVQNVRLYEEATHRAEQLAWAMQETHHRIKNNLHTVSAILDLYLMDAEQDRDTALDGLRHALGEIRTIAAVQDLISGDPQFGRVNVRPLLEQLVPMLVSGLSAGRAQVSAEVEAEDILVSGKIASSLALVTNELVSNAVRHGGQGRDRVTVWVTMRQEPQALSMSVRDDGPGFPREEGPTVVGVGLNLVKMLIVRDHGGHVQFTNNGGAQIHITIPFGTTAQGGQPASHSIAALESGRSG
ncbi:MAG TPA: ATP-binding protein [Chthonomonadaceae bacterium]|nr:ATP-binding protein [Chthonomonadaceae bacterium]